MRKVSECCDLVQKSSDVAAARGTPAREHSQDAPTGTVDRSARSGSIGAIDRVRRASGASTNSRAGSFLGDGSRQENRTHVPLRPQMSRASGRGARSARALSEEPLWRWDGVMGRGGG